MLKISKILRKNQENVQTERVTWGSHLEFFLSLIGYAVGLGNIWRFPYLCYRNGGGAFLIPYWLMLFVCGIPLFFLEVALGQFSSRGAIDVWNFCPLLKGVGIGTVLVTAIGSTSYNLIVAYILFFLFSSFKTPIPWGHCQNPWNTASCVVLTPVNENHHRIINTKNNFSSNLIKLNFTAVSLPSTHQLESLSQQLNNNYVKLDGIQTSTYEYWSHMVLKISKGLDDRGKFNVELFGCFIIAWLITYLCLIRGIKSTGKIVYVTATFPYLILTILLIRGLFLPGALKGIIFFLKPNWSLLKHFKVWNEAASQIFYSLGPGWSGLISMASYNKFRNNCLRDSLAVSIINTGTSLYAGIVVFSIIGFMSHNLNVPIDKVVTEGVGLAFIVYPEALLHLPLSNLWAFLFFLMLLTVGVDTMFVQMEVIYTVLYDAFQASCCKRYLFNFFGCVIMVILGLPFIYQRGIYLFQLVDWYFALLAIMTFCIFETVAIGWIYGAKKFINDIEFMLDRKIPFPNLLAFLWKILIPLILTIALIFNIVFYVPVQYGTYHYSTFALLMGWLISITSLLPIPLYAVYILLIKLRNYPFNHRLTLSLLPTIDWGPHSEPYRTEYLKYKGSGGI